MRPRTKHIYTKYHHFRGHVLRKEIEVHSVKTEDQLADLWTKPLSKDLFEKFTYKTMGFSIAQANKRVIAEQHETRECEISRLK